MDMTCRCKGSYTCVACKVKRGDYKDWIDAKCSIPMCDGKPRALGMCQPHYRRYAARRWSA